MEAFRALYALLERFIHDKIAEHLQSHNLIKDSQRGFRRYPSCLKNSIEFYFHDMNIN